MFKSKKNVLRFLRHRIAYSDVWLDRFNDNDVSFFFDKIIKYQSIDLEDLQDQQANFLFYILACGYIEVCDKGEYFVGADMRLTVKGYEYAQTNIFQRHPQASGIILGAFMSFAFAIAKTILDNVL